MSVGVLDRILEEVRALSDEDKARVRDEIDNWLGSQEIRRKEEELVRLLQAEGLVKQVPTRSPGDIERFYAWKPVEVVGKTLSETVIEERR